MEVIGYSIANMEPQNVQETSSRYFLSKKSINQQLSKKLIADENDILY